MKKFLLLLQSLVFVMMFNNLNAQYCTPSYSLGCDTWNIGLADFQLGSINQTVTCNGAPYYNDFTAVSTDLTYLTTNTITVMSGYQNVYVRVYIDYNQNNVFDDPSEKAAEIICSLPGTGYTADFQVPLSAMTGVTRLRVVTDYWSFPMPCAYSYYGNCTDFSVNIQHTGVLPFVNTTAATSIGTTTATLNGTVDPNGYYTEARFLYGKTVSYTDTIPGTPLSFTGTGSNDVSAALTGLEPNTDYHFMLECMNPAGLADGTDLYFHTLPAAPYALTQLPLVVTGTGATFRGLVNGKNSLTTTSFDYGTTVPYSDNVTGAPSTVSDNLDNQILHTITGLTPNTQYHYQINANNSEGNNTPDGGDIMFTTLSATTYQDVTSNLAAGATNQQVIRVRIANLNTGNPVHVTSFTFNTTGCTDLNDLSKARLYYTGISPVFSTGVQFGAEITNFGTLNSDYDITGNLALADGITYFWLVYDISSGATAGNYVDA